MHGRLADGRVHQLREFAERGREFVEKQGSAVNDAIKSGREAMQTERERLSSTRTQNIDQDSGLIRTIIT